MSVCREDPGALCEDGHNLCADCWRCHDCEGCVCEVDEDLPRDEIMGEPKYPEDAR